jgi:hypothetical protein
MVRKNIIRILLLAGCSILIGGNSDVVGNPIFAATSGGTCPASVPSGITSCYYADFANGLDTNSGTSESAPLKHFPGMAGCSGNCSSLTPSAGEGFILKGGVTWTSAALPWSWNWSGTTTTSTPGCTGSGCIYIGVDPNWYAGSSWARPILNSGGSSGNVNQSILNIGEPGNYIIFDNIEMTGFYWNGSVPYGTSTVSLPGGSPNVGAHDTLEKLYIHGWSHGTYASGTHEDACGVNGDTNHVNENVGSILEYSVIDGTDTDQQSCNGAVFGGPPYIAYNVFKYVSSCAVVDGIVTYHDNICGPINTTFDTSPAHQNGLEVNYNGQNLTVYNNVWTGIGSGALTVWLAPDAGYSAYFFNNVISNITANSNILDLAASLEGSTGTDILWNNTVECGPNSSPTDICAGGIASGTTAVTLQNNQFITNAGSYYSTNGSTPVTLHNNLMQTLSTANGQGYTFGSTYPFQPTSASGSTVGQGSSASSLCAASGVSACNSDTTYAVSYNSTNHTVSSPGRTATAWSGSPDIGAFSYGQSQGPGTPVNLKGAAQPQ